MAEIIQVVSEIGRVNLLCQLLTSNEDNCANFYSLGGVESILELKNKNLLVFKFEHDLFLTISFLLVC